MVRNNMTTQALKNWQKYKLGDLAQDVRQLYTPTKDEKLPYVGLEHIEQQTLHLSGVGQSNETESTKKIFKSGDVLFGTLRPYFRKVTRPKFNGVCSTDIAVIRPTKNSDGNFLKYFIANQDFIDHASNISSGTRMPRINWKVLKNQVCLFPKLTVQKEIGDILVAYDDLIENNTRRIQILEQMAQAIYTEWFVNFRFPGHKQIKMVDSGTDFGKIPEGWEVKNMTKFKCFNFFKPKVDRFDGVKRYFATADIGSLGFISEGEKVTFSSKPSRAQIQPVINSIWFARMKDTRKVCFFRNINADSSGNILLSSGMAGFRSEDNCFAFMFSTISSELFHIKKNLNATGATQISLTDEGLKQIKMVEPDISFVLSYTKIANPWLDEVLLLQNKNKILRKMRDLLLPKLVNGEIRV